MFTAKKPLVFTKTNPTLPAKGSAAEDKAEGAMKANLSKTKKKPNTSALANKAATLLANNASVPYNKMKKTGKS